MEKRLLGLPEEHPRRFLQSPPPCCDEDWRFPEGGPELDIDPFPLGHRSPRILIENSNDFKVTRMKETGLIVIDLYEEKDN